MHSHIVIFCDRYNFFISGTLFDIFSTLVFLAFGKYIWNSNNIILLSIGKYWHILIKYVIIYVLLMYLKLQFYIFWLFLWF